MYSHFLYKLAAKIANQNSSQLKPLVESLDTNVSISGLAKLMLNNVLPKELERADLDYLTQEFGPKVIPQLIEELLNFPDPEKESGYFLKLLDYMIIEKLEPFSRDFLGVFINLLKSGIDTVSYLKAFADFIKTFSLEEFAYHLNTIQSENWGSHETIYKILNPSPEEIIKVLIRFNSPNPPEWIFDLVIYTLEQKSSLLSSYQLGLMTGMFLTPVRRYVENWDQVNLEEFLEGLQQAPYDYQTISLLETLEFLVETVGFSQQGSNILDYAQQAIKKTPDDPYGVLATLVKKYTISSFELNKITEVLVKEVLKSDSLKKRIELDLENAWKHWKSGNWFKLDQLKKFIDNLESILSFINKSLLSPAKLQIFTLIEDFLNQHYHPEFEEKVWDKLGNPPQPLFKGDIEYAEIIELGSETPDHKVMKILKDWRFNRLEKEVFIDPEEVADVLLNLTNHHGSERVREYAFEALGELLEGIQNPAEYGIDPAWLENADTLDSYREVFQEQQSEKINQAFQELLLDSTYTETRQKARATLERYLKNSPKNLIKFIRERDQTGLTSYADQTLFDILSKAVVKFKEELKRIIDNPVESMDYPTVEKFVKNLSTPEYQKIMRKL